MSIKPLYYSQFGAVGNGIADDFAAIIRAHAAANEAGLPVCAEPAAVYYIGGSDMTAEVQTDTDWNTARFIIDDTNVENRNHPVFKIASKLAPIQIKDTNSLVKNQEKLDTALLYDSLIVAIDNTTKRYIREGANQDSGTEQTDVFVISKDGYVDPNTAIIWDFNNITSLTAHPIDSQTLVITGGHFTTIANGEVAEYKYFERNICIQRSNTVIDGLTHVLEYGKQTQSAPYGGFISIRNCAGITIQSCKLSAHKIFYTTGAGGEPVSMGTYDILAEKAVNLLFKNCRQLNDITDDTTWGIFGSNFTKNITFDTVSFSRFDAHKGTTNAVIINSEIGHMGILLIGSGLCRIENTKVHGNRFVNLREDYGSTWDGEIIIRNCEYTPGKKAYEHGVVVIDAHYTGLHDFGYTCHMPGKITIDNLIINDDKAPDNYHGPRILPSLYVGYDDRPFVEKYPYVLPKDIRITNISTKSNIPWVLSDSMDLYRDALFFYD